MADGGVQHSSLSPVQAAHQPIEDDPREQREEVNIAAPASTQLAMISTTIYLVPHAT